MAAFAVSWLTQVSEGIALCFFVLAIVLMVAPGGMRSVTWSSAAAGIAAIAALMVPVVIVAVLTTNLPIPQLSHGPVLRALIRVEPAQIAAVPAASAFSFQLPGIGFEPLVHRFGKPFSSVGSAAFVLAAVAVMIGICGSPALLSRSGATPGVYESRKSIGWAALLLGIVLLTLSAVAVFMRDIVLISLRTPARRSRATGLRPLQGSALARSTPRLSLERCRASCSSATDSYCVAGGGRISGGVSVSRGRGNRFGGAGRRLRICGDDRYHACRGCDQRAAKRASVGSHAGHVGARDSCAVRHRRRMDGGGDTGDPLELLLWSLALSGSSVFPVLVLSIWWKRTNVWGAMAGSWPALRGSRRDHGGRNLLICGAGRDGGRGGCAGELCRCCDCEHC